LSLIKKIEILGVQIYFLGVESLMVN